VPHPASVKSCESDLNILSDGNNNKPATLLKSSSNSVLSVSLSQPWDGGSILSTQHASNSSLSTMVSSSYDPTKDPKHVAAVYSMWSHFLDFCYLDENSIVREPRLVPPPDPTNPFNAHTGGRRLKIFMDLSQSK
jgi:hypothetical protein